MVPGPTCVHRALTFSPAIRRCLPEVNIAVPMFTSPARYLNPVRWAASRSAAKTSDGLAWKVIDRVSSPLTYSAWQGSADPAVGPPQVHPPVDRGRVGAGLGLVLQHRALA